MNLDTLETLVSFFLPPLGHSVFIFYLMTRIFSYVHGLQRMNLDVFVLSLDFLFHFDQGVSFDQNVLGIPEETVGSDKMSQVMSLESALGLN